MERFAYGLRPAPAWLNPILQQAERSATETAMATIIEAIYENGVLKPLATEGLKEQHRYRLSIEESIAPGEPLPATDREQARDAL